MADIDLLNVEPPLDLKEALVINLYGGPGTGKSSTMAGVFSGLKWMGLNCEQAPEFAKEKVWEGSTAILENQIYVFGKQLHTIFRVKDKVDVVITDSPLILSTMYGEQWGEIFSDLVFETYNKFTNLNYFLRRVKKYNPSGRLQTADQAKGLDEKLQGILDEHGIIYNEIDAGPIAVRQIIDDVEGLLPDDRFEFS